MPCLVLSCLVLFVCLSVSACPPCHHFREDAQWKKKVESIAMQRRFPEAEYEPQCGALCTSKYPRDILGLHARILQTLASLVSSLGRPGRVCHQDLVLVFDVLNDTGLVSRRRYFALSAAAGRQAHIKPKQQLDPLVVLEEGLGGLGSDAEEFTGMVLRHEYCEFERPLKQLAPPLGQHEVGRVRSNSEDVAMAELLSGLETKPHVVTIRRLDWELKHYRLDTYTSLGVNAAFVPIRVNLEPPPKPDKTKRPAGGILGDMEADIAKKQRQSKRLVQLLSFCCNVS